jgi:hypothetical protein
VLLREGVFQNLVDLSKLERCFVLVVADADRELLG